MARIKIARRTFIIVYLESVVNAIISLLHIVCVNFYIFMFFFRHTIKRRVDEKKKKKKNYYTTSENTI